MLRDYAEGKFIALPPPKPSRGIPRTPVRSMRAFYNASSGCFGRGPVQVADGTRRDISLVRPGDVLQSCNGPVSVRCVVETPIPKGVEGLVFLPGGITVTPWHPVRKEGHTKWTFPSDIAFPEWRGCKSVYNLVLSSGGSSFKIGEFDAVSLGHGLLDDLVAAHAYFGTERVLRDLSTLNGWEDGHVVLSANPLRRHPQTGAVLGLTSASGTPNNAPGVETY